MRFAVALGFRDVADNPGFRPYVRGQSSRRTIHDWVVDRYAALWPDAPIVESDSCTEQFNRSQARNFAVGEAFCVADVVLVADADVIPTPTATNEALRQIDRHPDRIKWATPYTRYQKAGRGATRRILNGEDPDGIPAPLFGWQTITGTAGLMLVTREAWETVGGYDETFTGWGWEDWAVVTALETLVHGVTRTPGVCVHLEHGRSRTRLAEKNQMEALYQPYIDTHGDADAMRAVLRERGVLS